MRMFTYTHEVAEDMLCRIWQATVSEQIAGEVQERLAKREFPRDSLDGIFKALINVLAESCKLGWQIWKADFQLRKAATAEREQDQHQPAELQIRAIRQQDMRNYLVNS